MANEQTQDTAEKEELTETFQEMAADEGSLEQDEAVAGSKLLQKQQELAEARDRMLRIQADFDNYRKRTQKEKEEWFKYASLGLIEGILPVLDNFERALASLDKEREEIKNLLAGVSMIQRQLQELLQKEGLEAIAALGQTFDPFLHEAIMQVPPEEGQADNSVVEELRKGYRFKDRVIRPALVKVAKNN